MELFSQKIKDRIEKLNTWSLKLLTAFAFLLTALNCNSNFPEEDIIDPVPIEHYSNIVLEILIEINKYRESQNLLPLIMNDTIYDEARKHTEYMIEKNAISHDNFSARASRLLTDFGGVAVAENVAFGYSTSKKVVEGWLSSPGHKKNIEGDYNITGISAIMDKNGRCYFTQLFVLKN